MVTPDSPATNLQLTAMRELSHQFEIMISSLGPHPSVVLSIAFRLEIVSGKAQETEGYKSRADAEQSAKHDSVPV